MVAETTAQTSTRVQRLRFASFDEEKPVLQKVEVRPPEKASLQPAAPLPPPAPTFMAKDIEAAKSDGHKQGYAEGYAAAEEKLNKDTTAREEATRALLDVIANRITIAAESHTTYIKGQEETMGKLAIAIARKLSSVAFEHDPYANIESLLRECMGLVIGATKVAIVVAPTRSVDLKRRLDTLETRLPGFEGELVVEEDAALDEQDCRVEWRNGYAEHNTEAFWKSIETIVAQKTLTLEGEIHG